jgi:hypothetical protein
MPLLLSVAIAVTTTACGRSGTTTPDDNITRTAEEIPHDAPTEAAPVAAGVGSVPDDPVGSSSDITARILLAFDTDALREVQLLDVQCEARLCSVSFEADPKFPVREILAQQLAQASHSVVAVHDGGPNLLRIAIPADQPDVP